MKKGHVAQQACRKAQYVCLCILRASLELTPKGVILLDHFLSNPCFFLGQKA